MSASRAKRRMPRRPRRDVRLGTVGARRGVLQSYRPRRRRPRRSPWMAGVAAGVLALAAWWALSGSGSGASSSGDSRRAAVPAMATQGATGGRAGVLAAKKAVKVASYLGSEKRRLEGFGPAPKALNLQWKLLIGSGETQRKQDGATTIWSGTGWTGQPTVLAEKGRTWLFVGGYDHNLHKIDAKTGKVRWEAEWPDVIKGTNTIVPNPRPADDLTRLIVVSGSRRGSDLDAGDARIAPLRAVSAKSGSELWRLPVPKTDNYSQDVDSSPLWYRGRLYAAVEPGYVYALDPFRTVVKRGVKQPVVLARSRLLYDKADIAAHSDTGGSNLAIESSPSAIGNVIYVTSGAGHIYGLDRRTLKVVWDFKTGSDIDGSPVVTDDGKLLVTIEKQYVEERGGAYLLDPSKPPKDAVVWYYPTPTRQFGEWGGGSVGSLTVSDAGKDGSKPRLAALATVDGQLRVVAVDSLSDDKAKGPGAKRAAPAPVEVFNQQVGASISTPVIVGDKIVCAGYYDKVHLYDIGYSKAKPGDEGAVSSPDGRWWRVKIRRIDTFKGKAAFESTPLVYRGRVYIGCRDGYLYCLGD